MSELYKKLCKSIETKKARVGVIGLGYVGLPIAMRFAEEGFHVTGFDVDPSKAKSLTRGRSYIRHIPNKAISALVKGTRPRMVATTDMKALKKMDCVVICVPTPLTDKREPDLSYVTSTGRELARHLKRGALVSLESTTYPGTTEEVLAPLLARDKFKAGRDFFLVYSPEREDPGRVDFTTSNTPKIVGGMCDKCLKAGVLLYSKIVEEVVPVSSMRVAEMSKLLENIYRSVNIALVNELKLLSDRMGIDIWEVIEAAGTKPFGFEPFYPGPGLGGHCIPIDPFYLTWKAREYDFSTRFIELAGEINTNMPYFVVNKTAEALNRRKKSLQGARVLVLGVAYKKDVEDLRESPAIELIRQLKERGAKVTYNDPLVPLAISKRKGFRMRSVPLTAARLAASDCVLIATNHSSYDYRWIVAKSRLVVDTRNATKGIRSAKIIKA